MKYQDLVKAYDGILSDLKNKIYKPIYLLMGDEPFYPDKIADFINIHVLNESEKAFNQQVVYGSDVDVVSIDTMARRFPMMSNHQVIIVKEAQNLKKIEDLVYYAQKPLKSTILVLNYKYDTIDKRKKLYKVIESTGVIFESKKLYDSEIPVWINAYLKSKGYIIDHVAGALLNDFLGNNLTKIANELDKMMISLPTGAKITTELIEQNIGISKDYSNFELQNAIGRKDIMKANRIVFHFAKNQKENPINLTIISLFSYFSKILIFHNLQDKSSRNVASALQVNPFFVKDYEVAAKNYNMLKVMNVISLLRDYDVRSKGVDNVSTTPEDLLKEMIFKILH
jgi:DNA polymerase-3 subunit delta